MTKSNKVTYQKPEIKSEPGGIFKYKILVNKSIFYESGIFISVLMAGFQKTLIKSQNISSSYQISEIFPKNACKFNFDTNSDMGIRGLNANYVTIN